MFSAILKVNVAHYTLPDLPYDYGVLQPTSLARTWSCITPDGFRQYFTANVLGVQRSGWPVLARGSLGQWLMLEQFHDHQGDLASATVPLLLLDMWEHAFYCNTATSRRSTSRLGGTSRLNRERAPRTVDNSDELMHAVLPAALEVLSAWSIAENEADPLVFRQAMDRTIGDAVGAAEPLRGLAEVIFGLSSLSGILLDELAGVTGRSRGEVLHAVHLRYLDPGARSPS